MNNRYAGKPFLKLVDSFVLDCIGELPREAAEQIISMEPKLHDVYAMKGCWQEIIRCQLGYDESVLAAIQGLWEKNREIARENGQTLLPEAFVTMFVDENILKRM